MLLLELDGSSPLVVTLAVVSSVVGMPVVLSFVVDVSDHYDTKRRALACHASQFQAASSAAVQTRLTTPLFQQLIESRDAQFGALAGVRFAEGIVVRVPVVRESLL